MRGLVRRSACSAVLMSYTGLNNCERCSLSDLARGGVFGCHSSNDPRVPPSGPASAGRLAKPKFEPFAELFPIQFFSRFHGHLGGSSRPHALSDGHSSRFNPQAASAEHVTAVPCNGRSSYMSTPTDGSCSNRS